jgi:hypothetical protein
MGMSSSVAFVGHVALHAVEALVFEEDHRVVIADGALEQALGVGAASRARPP